MAVSKVPSGSGNNPIKRIEKAEQSQERKPDIFDPIIDSFRQWLDYIRPNLVRYYTGILKINLASLFATWALLIAIIAVVVVIAFALGILVIGTGGISAGNSPALLLPILVIVAIIIIILAILALQLVQTTIESTSIVFTDAEFNDKDFSIMGTSGRIAGRILRYILVNAAIWIAILIPVIILAIALAAWGGGMISASSADGTGFLSGLLAVMAFVMLVILYYFIAAMVYYFLTQFWIFGFLVDGKGVIESLRASVSIIRKRPLEVIGFDILFIVGMLVFSIPLIIFNFIAYIPMTLLDTAARLSYNIILWGIYLSAVIVQSILIVFFTSFVQVFTTPAHYLFWKRIKE
jgi:hypothetical protein